MEEPVQEREAAPSPLQQWQQAAPIPQHRRAPLQALSPEEAGGVDLADLTPIERQLLALLPENSARGKVGQPGKPRFFYINGLVNTTAVGGWLQRAGRSLRRNGVPSVKRCFRSLGHQAELHTYGGPRRRPALANARQGVRKLNNNIKT